MPSPRFIYRHTGVKLVWQTHLGNTDLRANFSAGGKKELNVTTYQMCILLMFNGRDTLTLDEIREAVICPEVELRRHLLSLCTPKLKILSKESKCKGIVDGDIFTFNESFTSKYKRIKIPLISSKEITSDSLTADGINTISGIPVQVEEDRKHIAEAAIMRILKSRRTVSHNDLFAEVLRQLSSRFIPSAAFIKKRMESLIEREYIQRNPTDRFSYDYVA